MDSSSKTATPVVEPEVVTDEGNQDLKALLAQPALQRSEFAKLIDQPLGQWTKHDLWFIDTLLMGAGPKGRKIWDEERWAFMHRLQVTKLDPLAGQICAVWRFTQGAQKMCIQTQIDGFRLIAARTGGYAGSDEPVFEEVGKDVVKATVTVWRICQGMRCAYVGIAHMAEFMPKGKGDMMWVKMPHILLAKCAESQALRKGFPAELSGMYTFAEMAQASGPVTTMTEVDDTGDMPATNADKRTLMSYAVALIADRPSLPAGDLIVAVAKDILGKGRIDTQREINEVREAIKSDAYDLETGEKIPNLEAPHASE